MPRRVQGPDGAIHEFPDDATDAEISGALEAIPQANAKMFAPPARSRTWTDTAVEALPMLGGAAGGIVGGIGGTAFGMGIGGVPGAVGGAALGGGAGEAAKQLINRARGLGGPSTPTQAASQIGTQGAIQAGSELVGAGVGAAMRPVGAALMQSAVKPGLKATSRAIFRGVATEDLPIVKTLLKEGVNVSHGGIAKLDRIISATNTEIDDALKTVGGAIYPEAVAARVEPVVQRAATQVNPRADVRAAKESAEEFLSVQRGGQLGPTRPLNAPAAQALKKGTYSALKEKAYGELKAPAIEAQKALARGLKEDIESEALKQGVDIRALNIREGGAIEAKEAIARRLAAAGNRDPVALAWLAHNPTTGLLFMLERSPAVKSALARGLYNSAAAAAGVTPQVLRLAVHAVASSPDEMQTAEAEGQ